MLVNLVAFLCNGQICLDCKPRAVRTFAGFAVILGFLGYSAYAGAVEILSSQVAPPARAARKHFKEPRDSLAMENATQALTGRLVAAPPWSFACTTDHGPSRCGEPIWVYGNIDKLAVTSRNGVSPYPVFHLAV
jgi:hypothetical protein